MAFQSPLVTAALASADRIDTVLFFSDIDGAVRELTLPVLTAAPSASALDTLETIAENGGEISIPELTAAAGASKSTVARHVADLEDSNLVETWREGKVKCVRTVLAGEVRLAVGT